MQGRRGQEDMTGATPTPNGQTPGNNPEERDNRQHELMRQYEEAQ